MHMEKILHTMELTVLLLVRYSEVKRAIVTMTITAEDKQPPNLYYGLTAMPLGLDKW